MNSTASRFSRPPNWLGIHSPAFAGIIQVKHGGDGIDAQAVNMKTVAPEKGVGGQEIADFVAAVIEDQSAPILVGAFARVFVFVKGRAVETRQRPVVARKMGRHPIHQHADPAW
jgi:hypothetical protein